MAKVICHICLFAFFSKSRLFELLVTWLPLRKPNGCWGKRRVIHIWSLYVVCAVRCPRLSLFSVLHTLLIVYQEQFYKLNRGCLLSGLKAMWEFDVPTKWLQVKEKGHLLLRAESEEEAGAEARKVVGCGSPRQAPLEVWPQMASFTTGPPKWSSHRVYGEIWGIWQETDMDEIEENIMVNWWGSSVLLSSQTTLELAVTAPYVPYPELQQPSEEHLPGSQLPPIHLW